MDKKEYQEKIKAAKTPEEVFRVFSEMAEEQYYKHNEKTESKDDNK